MDILKTIHVQNAETAAMGEVFAPIVSRCGITFDPNVADADNVIVSEFADADSYDGVTECPRCFQRCADCGETMTDAEPLSPFVCNACADAQTGDDDYVIQNGAYNDARDHVFQNGRELFACYADVTEARIRAAMETAQFWPNVWRISDHGNADIVTMGEDSDPSRRVYVTSIHWRDCDTLETIIGTDHAKVETALAEALRDEMDRVDFDWEPMICADCDPETECGCADCDCHDPTLDDLCDTGISTETLGSVIRDICGSGRDADEKIADLLLLGIAHL